MMGEGSMSSSPVTSSASLACLHFLQAPQHIHDGHRGRGAALSAARVQQCPPYLQRWSALPPWGHAGPEGHSSHPSSMWWVQEVLALSPSPPSVPRNHKHEKENTQAACTRKCDHPEHWHQEATASGLWGPGKQPQRCLEQGQVQAPSSPTPH